jgi:hypothetical protein
MPLEPRGCLDAAGKEGRSKQPEVDFVNAMKRFLVRADICGSVETPRCQSKGGLSEQITEAKSQIYLAKRPP